jgi:hypothetical protein
MEAPASPSFCAVPRGASSVSLVQKIGGNEHGCSLGGRGRFENGYCSVGSTCLKYLVEIGLLDFENGVYELTQPGKRYFEDEIHEFIKNNILFQTVLQALNLHCSFTVQR